MSAKTQDMSSLIQDAVEAVRSAETLKKKRCVVLFAIAMMNNMPTKELKKEQTVEELMDNLKKCMMADLRAGRMILNADAKKRKAHYDLLKAQEAITAFRRENY